MKKLSLVLILSSVITTAFSQNIENTQIDHVTINQFDQEQAEHWGVTPNEWQKYKKYMEIEGKYFYEKLDPLSVLALMSEGAERNKFIQKQILFERKKVSKEVAFANDTFRMQLAMFGPERMLDFQSLPQMDGKVFDRRIHKSEPYAGQSIIDRARLQNNSINQNEIAFESNDEIWIIADENCDDCYTKIHELSKSQPLQIVVISLIKDENQLKTWVAESKINDLINHQNVRLELFDPLMFDTNLDVQSGAIYHARNGHVLRVFEQ